VSLDERPVLREVEVEAASGEWLAVVGPNGSGKTTLLRALAGLLPYSGSIRLHGREVRAWAPRERAKALALVRQQTDLPFAFSVREVVAMGRAPHRGWLSPLAGGDDDVIADAITELSLAELASRPVNALSGGEQQRVLLAQAMAQQAGLLLLDEPTAHLDVRHRLDVLDRVRALVRDGRTVIAAMHELDWAARYADRIVVLHRGRVAASGAPPDVLNPALMERVFGVRAEVESGPDGLRLRYLGSIPPPGPTPAAHAPEAARPPSPT
jgi:iron complex transport system ATP-binding protein